MSQHTLQEMRPSHQLPLVGLLLFSLIPGQLCETCAVSKENSYRLNPLKSKIVNTKYQTEFEVASGLLTLRLTGIQNQRLEQDLIQQAKTYVEKKASRLTSGHLAWFLVALGACQSPSEADRFCPHLIDKLEEKFRAEIEHMEAHSGSPLTNYYQMSMSLLALCLFDGKYSVTEVSTLFDPGNKNFYFVDNFSVDTGAMAVLALTCVTRKMSTEEPLESIENNIKGLVKKILAEKKESGLLGNIYSTGEAMQALFVSSNYYNENAWNCSQTLNAVLQEIPHGAFKYLVSAAQVLPALMGRTYLDVNRDSPCVYDSDVTEEPVPVTTDALPSSIVVHYSVRINETYAMDVTVPRGSVFLKVMEEAQRRNKALFCFTVEDTAWGPLVTSVQGLHANNNDRSYWQLLSDDKPLEQGAGSYVVHSGENLQVRWSKY